MLKLYNFFFYPSFISKIKITVLLAFLISFTSFAQETVRIMTYNICEYPNAATYGDTTYRNQYFRTVLSSVNPDILAVQEMRQ